MNPLLVMLGVWNTFVFLLYGVDKYKAIKNRWRISEKFLLTCAFLMGSAGAFLGMEVFRHKTKKPLFKIGVPFALVLNCVVLSFLIGRI